MHPRVRARHPDVTPADAAAAFHATVHKAPRIDTDPVQWVGVGIDGRGRLLEYVAVELRHGEWLIFHAMGATGAVLREVGLKGR